jgi:hypothetical protein
MISSGAEIAASSCSCCKLPINSADADKDLTFVTVEVRSGLDHIQGRAERIRIGRAVGALLVSACS